MILLQKEVKQFKWKIRKENNMEKNDGKNKEKNKDNNKNKKYYIILTIALILAIAVTVFLVVMNNREDDEESGNLAYTELITSISAGEIERIEMTVGSNSIRVQHRDREEEDEKRTALVPNIQAFIELIQEEVREGNEIELIQNPVNIFIRISRNTNYIASYINDCSACLLNY